MISVIVSSFYMPLLSYQSQTSAQTICASASPENAETLYVLQFLKELSTLPLFSRSVSVSPLLSLSHLFRLFLSSQLAIRQTLSNNTMHRSQEAVGIVTKSLIEAKRLLVQISEHMKRFDRNVGAFNTALQERPEVLDPVRVNRAVNVGFRMANELMKEVAILAKRLVRTVLICVDRRARFDVSANLGLQGGGIVLNDGLGSHAGSAFAVTLKKTEYSNLSSATCHSAVSKLGNPFVVVHITGFPADVGFVYFDFA